MKRFESPFLKLQRLAEQQARLAELDVARRRHELNVAEQQRLDALQQREDARDAMARQLQSPMSSSLLQTLAATDGAWAARLVAAQKIVQEREQVWSEAVQRFRQLKTRLESLSQALEQQRSSHRLARLREEQIAIDESSTARWNRPQPGAMSHG